MQGPQAAGMLGGILCTILVVIPIIIAVSAIVLRAAVTGFNKMSSPDNAVPEPSFMKAMGIAAASTIVSYMVNFAIGFLGAGAMIAGGANPMQAQIIIILISLPAGFLVVAGMLTAMLPASFGKSMIITLLYYLIAIAIAVFFAVVVFAVGAAIGIGMGR